MTNNKIKIVAHSLGVYWEGEDMLPKKYYRNNFCASEGHTDYPTLLELEANGHMIKRENLGVTYFFVTDSGKAAFEDSYYDFKGFRILEAQPEKIEKRIVYFLSNPLRSFDMPKYITATNGKTPLTSCKIWAKENGYTHVEVIHEVKDNVIHKINQK